MDNVENFQKEKIKNEIAEIMQQLQVVAENDRPRITERIFSNVFLPFFAGDENLTYKVTLQHWINAVGSPFAEVDVVNERNEVLFVVPALMDREALKPIVKDDNLGLASIAHVVSSAEQLSRIHPSQGSAHINAELSKRAMVMRVPASVLKDLQAWNAIFERYGRPPIAEVEPDKRKEASAGDSESQGGDYEFQPL